MKGDNELEHGRSAGCGQGNIPLQVPGGQSIFSAKATRAVKALRQALFNPAFLPYF